MKTQTPYLFLKKLVPIGGSLLVSVPWIWRRAHNLQAGDQVVIEVYEDCLIIKPYKKE